MSLRSLGEAAPGEGVLFAEGLPIDWTNDIDAFLLQRVQI
jgi:hypothetical protein